MIFEDNDSLSHFCCATASIGSSKSLTGLSREARNAPVCFPLDSYLCSGAGNMGKISKAYCSADRTSCCMGVFLF